MSTGDLQVLPGQDERFMAAISHALVIATGVGMVGGAVIWILQRQKSSYVAFQTLQAVTFQFVGMMLMWAGYACWGCLYGVSMVPLLTNPEAYGDSPPAFFLDQPAPNRSASCPHGSLDDLRHLRRYSLPAGEKLPLPLGGRSGRTLPGGKLRAMCDAAATEWLA